MLENRLKLHIPGLLLGVYLLSFPGPPQHHLVGVKMKYHGSDTPYLPEVQSTAVSKQQNTLKLS